MAGQIAVRSNPHAIPELTMKRVIALLTLAFAGEVYSGHIVNTLSGMNGEGPDSTRTLVCSNTPV